MMESICPASPLLSPPATPRWHDAVARPSTRYGGAGHVFAGLLLLSLCSCAVKGIENQGDDVKPKGTAGTGLDVGDDATIGDVTTINVTWGQAGGAAGWLAVPLAAIFGWKAWRRLQVVDRIVDVLHGHGTKLLKDEIKSRGVVNGERDAAERFIHGRVERYKRRLPNRDALICPAGPVQSSTARETAQNQPSGKPDRMFHVEHYPRQT